jgi:antitoxin component YwqK of YwqJK toxin-antitoxin module
MTQKIILLFFLFLFSNIDLVNAQESKKVQLKYKNGNLKTEYSIVLINGDTLYYGIYVDYYLNGNKKNSCYYIKGVIIWKEIFYDKRGRTIFIHEYVGEKFPRKIKTKAYFYTGACRFVEGEMIEKAPGNAVRDGIVKYYWKNMQVMDSVIFENDREIYRARFSKKGKFQFENRY